jgi:selenocysteine-specific translation elongation factor
MPEFDTGQFKVKNIQKNHKQVNAAKAGDLVAFTLQRKQDTSQIGIWHHIQTNIHRGYIFGSQEHPFVKMFIA